MLSCGSSPPVIELFCQASIISLCLLCTSVSLGYFYTVLVKWICINVIVMSKPRSRVLLLLPLHCIATQCSRYSLHCTGHSVHRTGHSVQCTLYNIHRSHCTVPSVECTLLYRPGATNYLVLAGEIQTRLEETVGDLQGRGERNSGAAAHSGASRTHTPWLG